MNGYSSIEAQWVCSKVSSPPPYPAEYAMRTTRSVAPWRLSATSYPLVLPAPAADDDNESFKHEKHGDDFVTRRLSVINPFDAGEAAEGEGEEKAGEGF